MPWPPAPGVQHQCTTPDFRTREILKDDF